MAGSVRLGVISDIHYASAAEKARGSTYEFAAIPNPLLRFFVRLYRRFFWLRDPLNKNYLLDRFLAESKGIDYLVANGDYACNTASLGMSDDAACQSARECLEKLRATFDGRLRVNFGDHELGKLSFFGGRGGMRLASLHRARTELGLHPFWQHSFGNYTLIGITSSLVALPVFEPDMLPDEREEWEQLRREHMDQIAHAFAGLPPKSRVLLFCHDPTALPFLLGEPVVSEKLAQVEATIIGHLHSSLILWKSRWLAGMPELEFLGHTAKRLSSALRQARRWAPFHVRLCPSLAGIELLKDGGYLTVDLDLEAQRAGHFEFHRLKR